MAADEVPYRYYKNLEFQVSKILDKFYAIQAFLTPLPSCVSDLGIKEVGGMGFCMTKVLLARPRFLLIAEIRRAKNIPPTKNKPETRAVPPQKNSVAIPSPNGVPSLSEFEAPSS